MTIVGSDDRPGKNSVLSIIWVNGPGTEEMPHLQTVQSQTLNKDWVMCESVCLDGRDLGAIHRREVRGTAKEERGGREEFFFLYIYIFAYYLTVLRLNRYLRFISFLVGGGDLGNVLDG